MALNTSAVATNIKRSLDKYIHINLSGVSIDFEGLPFNNAETTAWIQPRILDLGATYIHSGSATEYAEDVNVLLQINIFCKVSGVTTSDRHWVMRDQVAQHFPIGKDIQLGISGVTTGANAYDNLRIRALVTDTTLPETQELFQYVLAWEMNYVRLTTEA